MKSKEQKNKRIKIVVAMSGGVDSSVAAALLKKEGYDVVGVFMQFWFPSPAEALSPTRHSRFGDGTAKAGKSVLASVVAGKSEKYGENRCCLLESWREAQAVAKILDIPIYKVNFGRQFKKIIVDEFLSEYRAGHTPNPCVNCNKFIKFDLLLKYARTVFGADYLATGHYVKKSKVKSMPRTIRAERGLVRGQKSKVDEYKLFRAEDKNKDQSYFLYNLTQNQLKHLVFPLGDYTKKEVRKLAKKFKLPVHNKRDSQEICFVSTTVNDFLKRYLKLKKGDIVFYNFSPCLQANISPLSQGGDVAKRQRGYNNLDLPPTPSLRQGGGGYKVIGKHNGLPLYTLGQRSGIGLSGGPWYVSGFDRKKNRLIVTKNQKRSDIFQTELKFQKANWLSDKTRFPLFCEAQIRYHAKMAKCVIKNLPLTPSFVRRGRKNLFLPLTKGEVRRGLIVKFTVPQRAIMLGQSVVFYQKDEVLGGGVIV